MKNSTLPAGAPAAPLDGSLGDALLRDIAATGRLLGAQSVRASVVDLATMSMGSSWVFADQQYPGERPAAAPDSVFTAAPSTFAQLSDIGPEETLVRRLSPRRWAFAWRLDEDRAVVGEAQFRERRDSLDPHTSALLRLLCNSGIRSGVPSSGPEADGGDPNELAWPQVDRRARPKPTRGDFVLLGCSLAGVALSGWLLLYSLPRWQQAYETQKTRAEQLADRGNRTAAQGLSLAMASGDYGDVQSELSAFAALGYFSGAVVTSPRQRVIALVGPPSGQQIGDPLVPELERRMRRMPLATGSQEHGTLWIANEAEPDIEARTGAGKLVAALAALAALASATLLGLRLQRARQKS